MHAAPDFVVINKPAGVPVVPTVDNVLESCLACTAQVRLQCDTPLLLRMHVLMLLRCCGCVTLPNLAGTWYFNKIETSVMCGPGAWRDMSIPEHTPS